MLNEIPKKALRNLYGGHINVQQVLQAIASGMAECGVDVLIHPSITCPMADPDESRIFLPATVRTERALTVVSWYLDHEAGHIMFTPSYKPIVGWFDDHGNLTTPGKWAVNSKIRDVCLKHGYKEVPFSLIVAAKNLMNACEDTRMEKLVIKRLPGTQKHFIKGPVAAGLDDQIEVVVEKAKELQAQTGKPNPPLSPFYVAQMHTYTLLDGWHGSKSRNHARDTFPPHVGWVMDIIDDEFGGIKDVSLLTFDDIVDRTEDAMAKIIDKVLEDAKEVEGQKGASPPPQESPFQDEFNKVKPPPESDGDEESDDEESQDGDENEEGNSQWSGEPQEEDGDEQDSEGSGEQDDDSQDGPGESDEGDSESGDPEDTDDDSQSGGDGGSDDGDEQDDSADADPSDDDDDSGSGSGEPGDEDEDSDSDSQDGSGDGQADGSEDSERDSEDDSGESGSGSDGEDVDENSDEDDSDVPSDSSDTGDLNEDGSENDSDASESDSEDGDDSTPEGRPEEYEEDSEGEEKALPQQVEEWVKQADSDMSGQMAESFGDQDTSGNQGASRMPGGGGNPTPEAKYLEQQGMPDRYYDGLAPGLRTLVVQGKYLEEATNDSNFALYDKAVRLYQPKNLGPAARKLVGKFTSAPGRAYAGNRVNPRMLAPIRAGKADGKPLMLRRNDTIYSRKGVAVGLHVDCSGSMCSQIGGLDPMPREVAGLAQSKFLISHAAMRGLARVLASAGIPFSATGFTTCYPKHAGYGRGSRRLDIVNFIFKDFQETWNTTEKYMIAMNPYTRINYNGDVLSSHANADGESLLWAASRLLQREEDIKVLIVASDGQPAAGDGNTEIAFLKYAVHRCLGAGIYVGGLGIGTDCVKMFYPINETVHYFPPGSGSPEGAAIHLQNLIVNLIDKLMVEGGQYAQH